jgi:lipopolysaccharide/colanic/teichoic acid biosynthesis glycosyltransferase
VVNDHTHEAATSTALEQHGFTVYVCSALSEALRLQLRHKSAVVVANSQWAALALAWMSGAPARIALGSSSGFIARLFASDAAADLTALATQLDALRPCLTPQQGLPLLIKRGVDIAAAATVLVAAAPAFGLAAVAVRVGLGSPVLFRQDRPGRHGRTFKIFKLRTMSNARDDEGRLLPDEQRLTRLGKTLRKLSLDELPQLINVLRGEMSLIGPRPLLPQYLTRYSPEQRRRHNVLPGITGLAQVHGRNATTWPERLVWDVRYADDWSLLLDLRIAFETLSTLFAQTGISQPGHATMPEFTGNET